MSLLIQADYGLKLTQIKVDGSVSRLLEHLAWHEAEDSRQEDNCVHVFIVLDVFQVGKRNPLIGIHLALPKDLLLSRSQRAPHEECIFHEFQQDEAELLELVVLLSQDSSEESGLTFVSKILVVL